MAVKGRERLLLVVVLLCVGSLGLDRMVLAPLLRLWSTRAQRIVELQRLVDKGTLLAGREATLDQRWREMRTRSSSEVSVTENEVLKSVGNWTVASGLTVTSLKPRWILGEEDCKKLEIKVSTAGTLAAIARFLYELEVEPQALKVEDVVLSARDERGQMLAGEVRFTRLVLEDGKP